MSSIVYIICYPSYMSLKLSLAYVCEIVKAVGQERRCGFSHYKWLYIRLCAKDHHNHDCIILFDSECRISRLRIESSNLKTVWLHKKEYVLKYYSRCVEISLQAWRKTDLTKRKRIINFWSPTVYSTWAAAAVHGGKSTSMCYFKVVWVRCCA